MVHLPRKGETNGRRGVMYPVLARIQVEIQTVLRNARHDHRPGRYDPD